jgi:hypothetical protein
MIKTWYNGYTWDGASYIYNPFSTLLLFNELKFSNHWFRSGSPTFLINLIKEKYNLKPLLRDVEVDKDDLDIFELSSLDEITLLFQTGYLTIKKRKLTSHGTFYTLTIPNMEVKQSLYKYLLNSYTGLQTDDINKIRKKVIGEIEENDNKGMGESISKTLSKIAYDTHIKKEHFYHNIFLIWMYTLGFNILPEVHNNQGRMDALIQYKDQYIVSEFKYEENLDKLDDALNDALNQTHDRQYFLSYPEDKVKILTIAFNRKKAICKFHTPNF